MALVRDWKSRLGRRLRLRDLHILSVVVRCGSMVKASAELGMSQPAVSQAIAALEETLGVRLLDRSSVGVEVTAYGAVLLKREVAVFEELGQAIKDIQYLNDPSAGEVRIGCAESLAAGVLPALVDGFARSNPKVAIHVLTALAAKLEFRELRDRTVDLMIGRIFTPFDDPDIDVDVIGHDDLFVVAGSRSPWARRRALALDELMDEPWIFYPRDNRIGLFAENVFRSNGLVLPRESVVSNSLHLRLQLLRTGRYLTMLHGSVLRLNAGPWSLKALPVDLSRHTVPVAIFTLRNRTLNPVVSRFIQHAHETSVAMAHAPIERPATLARHTGTPPSRQG